MPAVLPGLSTESIGTGVMHPPQIPMLMGTPYGAPVSTEPSMPYNVTYPQGFTQTSPLAPTTPVSCGASPSASLPPPQGIIMNSLVRFEYVPIRLNELSLHYLQMPIR